MAGMQTSVDILIIGGGVNGVGIARDAAGRGLKTLLCEQNDLASATSSASTKLVHGGLRYLEHFEFRLVRESLQEREILLRAAPHIIWPMRFVLPHHKGLRPRWMLRAGLFLYDHIGGRKLLPPTKSLSLSGDPRGAPLKPQFRRGFEYSDCWVDDARLVALNAVDAAERGATILTRTKAVSIRSQEGIWIADLESEGGASREVRTRALVNAAGPWVDEVLRSVVRQNDPPRFSLRLIKGSHIIVNKVFDGEHAYIFQNADGRIIFAIPYQRDFTLIGTTDEPFEGDLARVAIDQSEIDYLCAAASEYFAMPVTAQMVRRTYSGVRPLYKDSDVKDASAVTRDYVFDVSGAPPLLSIYGGKITTYRRLAEHALAKLQPLLGFTAGPWTQSAALPGGDIENADFDAFLKSAGRDYPWLSPRDLHRLGRAYGTRLGNVLSDAASYADLGEQLGQGLSAREVDYLRRVEFAATVDDILWRRTKLSLRFTKPERENLEAFLAHNKATERRQT